MTSNSSIQNPTFVPPHPLKAAVLFLVFNRLNTTKQVFEAIRQAKPPRLYVAADGPRKAKDGEDTKVKEVRDFVISNVDWDCEVKTLFRKENLGCKIAVSGAIDWFFENEEMGIILEDDCLPSQSFFWFCEELLERYKNDMRVWHVGGNNFGYDHIEELQDYTFTRYGQVWGWASWKNRWDEYEPNLKDFESNFTSSQSICSSLDISYDEFNSMKKRFYNAKVGKINTWDYQWQATIILNHGLCIVPFKNLIKNLGDGIDATHTKNDTDRTHLPIFNLKFPVSENKNYIVDYKVEYFIKRKMGIKLNILNKVKQKLKRIFSI
jgi:hypothetical protein